MDSGSNSGILKSEEYEEAVFGSLTEEGYRWCLNLSAGNLRVTLCDLNLDVEVDAEGDACRGI